MEKTSPSFPLAYYLILCCLYLISLPFLIFFSYKKKYKHSIPARFFLKDFSLEFSPSYWFHACSFGESKSYEPILQALIQKEPQAKILLTCITNTGYAYLHTLKKKYPHNITLHYLPFEIFLPLWLHMLKDLKTLVVTEAELWRMLFWVGKRAGGKTLLLNARISDRSLKNYQKMKWFYSILFQSIDQVLAQSETDKERLQDLGAQHVQAFGNLKIFSTPEVNHRYTKQRDVILCASSHKGEEELILQAFLSLSLQATLIVVPRHPERFKEVKNLCEQMCKQYEKKFSTYKQVWGDVVLVDAMGELNNFYAIADCVILGGSFVPVGGHNPLEPAFFHAPILSGKYIFNQKSLFSLIEGYQLIENQELQDKLQNYKNLQKSSIRHSQNKLDELLNIICLNPCSKSI